jgi:hypothetical protein
VYRWPLWPLVTALWVLFLGPLIAPLFQATTLPLVADSGGLARDLLATYICPTPAKSYVVAGFPMAVCARCWGATIGLWAAYLLFRHFPTATQLRAWVPIRDRYLGLPWLIRLAISALPFVLWMLEIAYWPAAPYRVLLANGAFAGLSAGLFFCSIWPGLRARPARTA